MITDKEREVINRSINGIVYAKFGGVCLDTEFIGNKIKLTVWDKSCKCGDKKVVIKKEFIFKNLSSTIASMESYIYN